MILFIFKASDPCMLDIEGVIFGITSTDILFHLGKEEISFPPHSGDRLRRLANHLVQQRSFYPLYPPNFEMSIDYGVLEEFGQVSLEAMSLSKEVLVVSSKRTQGSWSFTGFKIFFT